jgi:trimethylamine-N-oxide reductase (cytochrome c)
MRKRLDPERPDMADDKPAIIKDMALAAVDDDALALDWIYDLTEALYVQISRGEKILHERCAVRHGPRDPAAFTQLQWRWITPSMHPRAPRR